MSTQFSPKPILKYPGAKWSIAPWIVPQLSLFAERERN